MQKAILLVAFVFFQDRLLAYPIDPLPLRVIIMNSEYIIRGRVVETGREESTQRNYINYRNFAILEIKQVLQGVVSISRIKVCFIKQMICPEPGVLYDNEEVLVFLNKNKKDDTYEISGLTYGVKHKLTEDGFAWYAYLVKEIHSIQAKGKQENTNDQILEWLVQCSENETTRWDGVSELSPESNFMMYYKNGIKHRNNLFLTPEQLTRLFTVLLKDTSLNYEDMILADIVTGVDDCALLEKLKIALQQLNSASPWNALLFMDKIFRLTCDPVLEALNNKYISINPTTKKEKKEHLHLLQQFKQRMARVHCTKPVPAPDRASG
jgi:hypothetical protein